MSYRIRGQEVTMKVAVDGKIQEGSWAKITDFTITPREDLTEESFMGETEDDIDFQHHGFDFAFTCQKQDEKFLQFLKTIVDRERLHQTHPDIVITVLYAFREPGAINQVEVYNDVFLKIGDTSFGSRKEYVTTSVEGKCKRRSLLAQKN